MGLTFDKVSKSYGSFEVLSPLSLDVADGEFLTILGPSGSGKTTMLKLAGGFTQASSGRILFSGQDITQTPTNKRPFNTVFQDYALFPHLSAAKNIGYGLMVRGRPKAEIAKTVEEALGLVGLSDLGNRLPAQLSGGQCQRVALARAIVCEPKLILLDEPLAALDATLRRQMQVFLKSLQRRIATTFLFVTHDQEEAIAMSDRIVVMNKGKIEQIGTPEDLYYSPKTHFVAEFFGDNNLIAGTINGTRVETVLGDVPAASAQAGKLKVAIRPERIALGKNLKTGIQFDAVVSAVDFIGAMTHVTIRPNNAPEIKLTVKVTSDPDRNRWVEGSATTAGFDYTDVAIVAAAS